jgi:hypothetical protein
MSSPVSGESVVAQHLLAKVRLALTLLVIMPGLFSLVGAAAHEGPRVDAYDSAVRIKFGAKQGSTC